MDEKITNINALGITFEAGVLNQNTKDHVN